MEELKCDLCGKVCKSKNTFNIHRKACEAKHLKSTVPGAATNEDVDMTEKSIINNDLVTLKIDVIETTKPGVAKELTKEEQLKVEVNALLNSITTKNRMTQAQANKVMDLFNRITGYPKQPTNCASCLNHCYKTLLLNR